MEYDYLVIGSGIAGMSFALKVAEHGRVALICKTTLDEANTALAQGGVASVTNLAVDNFEKHIHDTMVAGDWLSDPAAVRAVVTGAPKGIKDLLSWGVNFDRREDGSFDLHREGGHSEFRILHHADNTGFEIQRGLIEAVRHNPNIDIYEHHFAIEIITQHHLGRIVTRRTPDITCYGAYVLDQETGKVEKFLARVTVMATGGVGAVYQTTTNPLVATGDGIAWYTVPRERSKIWNLYSSILRRCSTRAIVHHSLLPKPCAAMVRYCATYVAMNSCRSMTLDCRWRRATLLHAL